jgi:hypothetical protein
MNTPNVGEDHKKDGNDMVDHHHAKILTRVSHTTKAAML